MGSKSDSVRFAYLGLDTASIKQSLSRNLVYNVGKSRSGAGHRDWYHATVFSIRDRLVERWLETMRSYDWSDSKRVYYFSLEFLIGRSLRNSLLNINIEEECRQSLHDFGVALESIEEVEPDAALGNGGLGRLAACFLDSMATLRLPGFGYGIRYEYGMFRQAIENGCQIEHPDSWLRYGNPWEFPRPEILYQVQFYGRVERQSAADGEPVHRWVDTDDVMAMAYDTLIPGYHTNTVNHLRLWSAKASRDFNLTYFNEGNYVKAVEEKTESENLSRVLYPGDSTTMGRELRLQQEYFFVSAALQDILADFMRRHESLDELPERVAIQLNDTHPAIAVAELMRLLTDRYNLEWERAWSITCKTFSYTNHTRMPEALEKWPVDMMERLLPRHMQIIYEINHHFLNDVRARFPGDNELVRRVSLIDETPPRSVRMAHLATVGSHRVNGVSAIHTELLQQETFADFHRLYPDRIINVTNGVTPRRWLKQADPLLADLISTRVGQGWISDLDQLERLREAATDEAFQQEFRHVKKSNKAHLARLIRERLGLHINPESLFDVQIKRIHEYKRQTLNLLHAITLYNRIRDGRVSDLVPRTIIISGKAAPGYWMAKLIIRAINDVATAINADPGIGDSLKLVFIPNYDVTTAEDIIPAAELSEQISLAGTEASGTGNMKLAMNGALTIGTLDGANVEIRDAAGEDNIFAFGLSAEQAGALSANPDPAARHPRGDPELEQALEMLAGGYFSPDEPERFQPLVKRLTTDDPYLTLADFRDFVDCQTRVERLYRQPDTWTHRAILNVAATGRFSSDRAVRDYAEKIWKVVPVVHA